MASECLFRVRRALCLSGGDCVRLSCATASSSLVHVALVTQRRRLLLLRLSVGGETGLSPAPPHIQQLQLPPDKLVTALCLQPQSAASLLLTVDQGALYVLGRGGGVAPAVWVCDDPHARLSSVDWWTRRSDAAHLAVVGDSAGQVHVLDLASMTRLHCITVSAGVLRVHVVRGGEQGGACWALIGCQDGQQWRVILEHEDAAAASNDEHVTGGGDETSSVEKTADLLRARLSNLKQFSRDKLGMLQQRWSSAAKHVLASSSCPSNKRQSKQAASSDAWRPENLAGMVGDVAVWPHLTPRNTHLLTGFYEPLSSLSVYDAGRLHLPPLSVHQLYALCPTAACKAFDAGMLVLADWLLFVGRPDCGRLCVLSSALTRCDAASSCTPADTLLADLVVCDPARDSLLAVLPYVSAVPPARQTAPMPSCWAHVKHSPLAGCLLVCSSGVSVCEPVMSAESACVAIMLAEEGTLVASRLARLHAAFQHSQQQRSALLEVLGDLRLRQRRFPQAFACYRQLKLSPAQVMHKLAAGGFTAQLLLYVGVVSRAARLGDDPRTTADVSLLCLVQMALRSPAELRQLIRLLRTNRRYSVSLAVRACNTPALGDCWSVLCESRGAHSLLLSTCCQSDEPHCRAMADVLLSRRSSSALLDDMNAASIVLHCWQQQLPIMQLEQLRQLISLTDPLSVHLAPLTRLLLTHHHQCHSDDEDKTSLDQYYSLAQRVVSVHLSALIQCITPADDAAVQLQVDRLFSTQSVLACLPACPPAPACSDSVTYVGASVSGTHAAAVSATGHVHVWLVERPRSTVPLCSALDRQHSSMLPVTDEGCCLSLAGDLVKVSAVACGRHHTLLLSTAGVVYAAGSSPHGQLGLGARVREAPRPRPLVRLSSRRVTCIAAGRHHSLAVCDDGRVCTWGWNVFGQCGHGHVDDVLEARTVRALRHVHIRQAAGGHAHSAVLTDDGRVFVFGSNWHGQLGGGCVGKTSEPRLLDDVGGAVRQLTCGSFTCVLQLRDDGRVLRVGCDPQTVRCLSQRAQRRTAAAAAGTVTPGYRGHFRPAVLTDAPSSSTMLAAGTRHVACAAPQWRHVVVLVSAATALDGAAAGDTQHCLSLPADCGHVHKLACGPDSLLVLTSTGHLCLWHVQRLGRVESEHSRLRPPPLSSPCHPSPPADAEAEHRALCCLTERRLARRYCPAARVCHVARSLHVPQLVCRELIARCGSEQLWSLGVQLAAVWRDWPVVLECLLSWLAAYQHKSSSSSSPATVACSAFSRCVAVCDSDRQVRRALVVMIDAWRRYHWPGQTLETALLAEWQRVLPSLAWLVWRFKMQQLECDDDDSSDYGDELLRLLSPRCCAALCAAVCARVRQGESMALSDSLVMRLMQRRQDAVLVLPSTEQNDKQSGQNSSAADNGVSVAFSCGHTYLMSEYRDVVMPAMARDLSKLSLPDTRRHLLTLFNSQQLDNCNSRTCPPCAVHYVRQCVSSATQPPLDNAS